MNLYYVLPLAIGASIVFQASLNRDMALYYGLSSAVLLNAAVFLILSLLLFALGKYTPSLVPEFLQVKTSEFPLSLTYFIPGICGFFIVVGAPWAFEKIGPANTFTILIASQIVLSLLLEAYSQKSLPNTYRLAGAGLVVLGGILSTRG